MRLFNPHFLRILVALLVTVFITNTVYAGGMMVSATISSISEHSAAQPQAAHDISHQVHDAHHRQHSGQQHSGQQHHPESASLSHQSQHQSPAHGGCSHCNHCLACYSIILYDEVDMMPVISRPVLAQAGKDLYLSPAAPQPSKPPII